MDFLKQTEVSFKKIPSGSYTVNSAGKIISSTIPSWVPAKFLSDITTRVISTFSAARENGFVLNEVVIKFPTIKIIAREMRCGFFINLMPVTG